MKKKGLALLCCLTLWTAAASAELTWPALSTQGQANVQSYVQQVNQDLAALGAPTVNAVFECFPGVVSLGITGEDNAEMSEGVELSFSLSGNVMTALTIRATNLDVFASLVASCLQAANPGTETSAYLDTPASYVQQARSHPDNSFGADMTDTDWLQGDSVRVYYSYRPDEFHDGENWLQAVLVFPRSAEGTPEPTFAPAPTPTVYQEESWESEVDPTPTPVLEFQSIPNSVPEGELEPMN